MVDAKIVHNFIYLLSLLFTLCGTYFLYSGFKLRRSATSRDENATRITDIAKKDLLPFLTPRYELLPHRLVHGEALTHSAAEIGIASIEYLLTSLIRKEGKSPYLFGVNKGGAFLANYLAHRAGLHEKYLVKCDYRTDYQKIYCESRDISGPIIIIDDVVRTGKTLSSIKKYLSAQYPTSKIYTFALVAVRHEGTEKQSIEIIDYSPWFTSTTQIQLPWSKDRNQSIKSDAYFDDTEIDQILGRIT